MKNVMLGMILTFSMSIVGTSQVKEKFRDRKNTSTIVVIKDDKAIDTDLLDEHFDLSSMSMNDQIMITTKPEAPSIPEATPLPETAPIPEAPAFEEATANINDDVDIFFEDFDNKKEEDKEKTAVQESNADADKSAAAVVSKVETAPKRARGNYPTKSGYEVRKEAQKKYFAKSKIRKNKKKKRKWFGKKKSNSCYSF